MIFSLLFKVGNFSKFQLFFFSFLNLYIHFSCHTQDLRVYMTLNGEPSVGLNTFLIGPPIVKRGSEIAFVIGQPLGYYKSWSLVTLPLHYIVWLAAKYAYPTSTNPFADYALIGDDILITNVRWQSSTRHRWIDLVFSKIDNIRGKWTCLRSLLVYYCLVGRP